MLGWVTIDERMSDHRQAGSVNWDREGKREVCISLCHRSSRDADQFVGGGCCGGMQLATGNDDPLVITVDHPQVEIRI